MQVLLESSREADFFSVNDIAFSPDGSLLAAAVGFREKGINRWNGQVLVWRLGSDAAPVTVHECRNTTRFVAFSPDGELLVAPSGDWSIRVWQTGDWQEVASFKGHTRPVFALAFSPDGKELLTGSGTLEHPGEAICWNFPGGKQRWTKPSPKGVWAAAYAPAGKTIALATKAVEVCDSTGATTLELKHKNRVREVIFSKDGRNLATLTSAELRWWDLATGQAKILCQSDSDLRCLQTGPDGRFLAWGGNDGLVHLWNLTTMQEQVAYRWEVGHVMSLAFSPQGMSAAVGGDSRAGSTLVLWDFDVN